MNHDAERLAVIADADKWIGTPYRKRHRKMGHAGGTDCIQLIAAIMEETNTFTAVLPPTYPEDAPLHSKWKDSIIETLSLHALDVTGQAIHGDINGNPPPGDIIVFKWRGAYSHAGLVIMWPKIITVGKRAVQYTRVGVDPLMPFDGWKIFDPWAGK